MNMRHEQFIGIYENAFSKEYCERTIKFFENLSLAGYSYNRQQNSSTLKLHKDDLFVCASLEKTLDYPLSSELQTEFNEVLWQNCYPQYADTFWPLKDYAAHNSYNFKIQKTEPGQGYHVWHCESSNRSVCNRILVWTLYLNDVEEGGETEFIFQHVRIKPKTGTLVIWPAGFTHTHRGNPPLSGVKYIVTGWIEF